jgi:small conductance mechanosensitive channel
LRLRRDGRPPTLGLSQAPPALRRRDPRPILLALCVSTLAILPAPTTAKDAEPPPPPQPVTTVDPTIPVDELELLVEPLTAEELLVEADAWRALLKQKVAEISGAEVEIKKKNRAIEQAEDIKDAVGEAKESLKEVEQSASGRAGAGGAGEAAREAQQAVEKVADTVKAAGHVAADAPASGGSAAGSAKPKLEQVEKSAEAVAESRSEEKVAMLDVTNALREERTGLIDRLNVVLDELNDKLGKTVANTDNDKVVPYRLYAESVGGLKVDVSDTQTALATILGWLKSEEGGLRWAKNIGVFAATVLLFGLLARVLARVVERGLRLSENTSVLLRDFAGGAVRYVVTALGILIGLSALEVNIAPLVAAVGAAGFVMAFALQSTLSNFASGLMIMFYRPFDVGDTIRVANLVGTVKSMNLVNTTITASDNQVMIVPNNAIWGSTITNVTGSKERRVDLTFGIGHKHDILRAQQILEEVVNSHPLVLKEPGPTVQLDEMTESSVNLVCRPWVKTGDYGQARGEILRAVKERFDQAGITREHG